MLGDGNLPVGPRDKVVGLGMKSPAAEENVKLLFEGD